MAIISYDNNEMYEAEKKVAEVKEKLDNAKYYLSKINLLWQESYYVDVSGCKSKSSSVLEKINAESEWINALESNINSVLNNCSKCLDEMQSVEIEPRKCIVNYKSN